MFSFENIRVILILPHIINMEENIIMYKTGDKATSKGKYKFVRYTTEPQTPRPSSEESTIPLDVGDTFPPIRSTGRGAYWDKA
jgi:hypothetical protein